MQRLCHHSSIPQCNLSTKKLLQNLNNRCCQIPSSGHFKNVLKFLGCYSLPQVNAACYQLFNPPGITCMVVWIQPFTLLMQKGCKYCSFTSMSVSQGGRSSPILCWREVLAQPSSPAFLLPFIPQVTTRKVHPYFFPFLPPTSSPQIFFLLTGPRKKHVVCIKQTENFPQTTQFVGSLICM